jgi:signal transduction histidine kinase
MNYSKLIAMAVLPGMVAFAQVPSSAEAAALVKEAVAFAKQNGMARLIQETNQPKGRFHVSSGSELYIFIYNDRGVVKAIGYDTEALVGVNRFNLKDPTGFMMVREFINVAQTRGKGWVDYKYPNPTTGRIEQKTSYLEFYEDSIIGSGVYKD